MILLAGVLLTLAFIVFSMQLNVLNQLGQQVGREAENPLVHDYLNFRDAFKTTFEGELRNADGAAVCPDLYYFAERVLVLAAWASAIESGRGHVFALRDLVLSSPDPNPPDPNRVDVRMRFIVTDSVSQADDTITYQVPCTVGTVDASGCPNPLACRPAGGPPGS